MLASSWMEVVLQCLNGEHQSWEKCCLNSSRKPRTVSFILKWLVLFNLHRVSLGPSRVANQPWFTATWPDPTWALNLQKVSSFLPSSPNWSIFSVAKLSFGPLGFFFSSQSWNTGKPKRDRRAVWMEKNNLLYLDMECKKLEKACRTSGIFPTYLIAVELWVI